MVNRTALEPQMVGRWEIRSWVDIEHRARVVWAWWRRKP